MKKKAIIMGAAGRDFHDFNTYFRNNDEYEVVAFTASQIPDIAGRKYPKELSGKLYPQGIPIFLEDELPQLIKKFDVDEVFLSYSDLTHADVMHKASIAIANGAQFSILGPKAMFIKSTKPVVAVCAVRTGCGKSQTSRKVVEYFKNKGHKIVAVRHPMPYGDLAKQAVQRFAEYEDLNKHECTIEEREEYEPYIAQGLVIYSGVDYEKILRQAEKEADIILWDGGNNDLPFYKPDLHIVVADPHRLGHETSYHPGEANIRMADVIIINKVDSAKKENVEELKRNIQDINPRAVVILAASPLTVEKKDLVKGKRVLVIEDGPTLTHGEMAYGAGVIAAKNLGAKELIDPRPFAVGSIEKTFKKFKQLKNLLPAMGYGEKQMKELEDTINKSDAELVVIGTPIDLGKLLKINKPSVRVHYRLEEIGKPDLDDVLKKIKIQ